MALTPEAKKEIISKYGSSATDTGSPEAQVALLSKRIDEITEHLQTNKVLCLINDEYRAFR